MNCWRCGKELTTGDPPNSQLCSGCLQDERDSVELVVKRYDNLLGCCPARIAYDFQTRKGELFLVAGQCCDMDGCLSLFKGIDPGVREIQTYSGDERDTRYVLVSHGKWSAVVPIETMMRPGWKGTR